MLKANSPIEIAHETVCPKGKKKEIIAAINVLLWKIPTMAYKFVSILCISRKTI